MNRRQLVFGAFAAVRAQAVNAPLWRDVSDATSAFSEHLIRAAEWQSRVQHALRTKGDRTLLASLPSHPAFPRHGLSAIPLSSAIAGPADVVLFKMDQGSVIPPHEHHNMASLLVVLKGVVSAFTFDRLDEGQDYVVVRANSRRVLGVHDSALVAGEIVANGHAFVAERDAIALDIQLLGFLKRGIETWNHAFVLPSRPSSALATVRAPIVDWSIAQEQPLETRRRLESMTFGE